MNVENISPENPERTIRLLLLDDSPADTTLIKRALKKIDSCNYHVNSFSNMAEAIGFLEVQHDQVDACLVDYCLGEDTAFDVIQEFQRAGICHLPIVVISGQTDSAIDKQLMQIGIHDYWSKTDLRSENLERCIRYAIHRHTSFWAKHAESVNKTSHLAYISHELKNPLQAVIGFTRMAQKLWQTADSKEKAMRVEECFDLALRYAEYTKSLVDELLDLSAMEAGHFTLACELFNLNELIEELFQAFKPIAEQEGLSFTLELNDSSQINLYADPKRLCQIVSNLLSNAIKYTEVGGVTLTVKEVVSGGVKSVVISVSDTGVGIDKCEHATIFNEFEKLSTSVNKDVDSTGLGLTIAKRLVELHGGSIELQSDVGQGSVFTVKLPQSGENGISV